MAEDSAYRIFVTYRADEKDFVATVPELSLSMNGETRAEALAEAEAAIETKLESSGDEGLPRPVDVEDFETTLEIELAKPIMRELAFHAKDSGLSTETFAQELLSNALGALGRPSSDRRRRDRHEEHRDPDAQPQHNTRDGGGRRRRGREGYRPELEDKANFLEYLRNLEKDRGGQGGGRRRR